MGYLQGISPNHRPTLRKCFGIFYLRTFPQCCLGLLEKELSFRLGLVVLVALTWSAFTFLDTFNPQY
jgi:hypothetical protein